MLKYAMNISQIYDELSMYKNTLLRAEKEYHGYVTMGGWSDEICHEVDILKEVIRDCNESIVMIEEFLLTI